MSQAIKKEWSFQKKILMVLFFLFIYKVGTYISVPGINKDILQEMLGGTGLGALSSLMSGGAMLNFSIFALGVIPYITASIIIQLLSFNLVPALVELKKQGDFGKKKTKRITLTLAMVLAMFQSVAITFSFGKMYDGFIVNNAWYNYVLIAVILTLGCALLIYFGEKIDKYKVGSGLSILIFGSILMSLPSTISSYYVLNIQDSDMMLVEIIKGIILLLLVFGLIVFVTFIHLSQRKIPIHNARQGNSQFTYDGEQKNYLPIKIIGVGVIPVIFAVSLIMTPTTIAQMNPNAEWASFITKWLSMNSITGAILYVLVILFFTYFYTALQFDTEEIASNLHKGQSFIPGIKPGSATEKYLSNVFFAMATIGGIVLSLIAIMPLIISAFISLPTTVQIGGISLLIIVNVSLDIFKNYEINKKSEKQRYKGLLKK